MKQLSKNKLTQEARKIFVETENRRPKVSDKNTLLLFERLIQHGYKMGYDKFYVPMCQRCKYRNATCFGPGAFCDDCSMEEEEERL